MARFRQTRKRSRSVAPFMRRKRTRFARKRRGRARIGKPSENIIAAVPFRTRRISRRAYKKKLWDYTSMLTKYRSALNRNSSIDTLASTTGWKVDVLPFMIASDTSPFYTTTGGLLAHDTGVTGTFKGNLVIRGGQLLVKLFNNTEVADGNNDSVECVIAIIKGSYAFDSTALVNTTPSVRGIDYAPDFARKFGRLLVQRRFIIKEGESQSLAYRLPIHKVDEADYVERKHIYYLYIAVQNGFVPTIQTCTYAWGHDLTFTGDLIT